MSLKRDTTIDGLVLLAFFIALGILVSCVAPKPLSPIYPPGWTPSQAVKNSPKAVKMAVVAPPMPTIVLTCDFGDGPRDGEHIYIGKQLGQFPTMLTFPPTNIFTVPCDNNTPSFIEIRSFVNLPDPGIVQTFTNDDGSLWTNTITFRESIGTLFDPVVSDFVFVPTGCQSVGLFNYGSNLVVAGWAVGGKVYQILSAPTLDTPAKEWQTNAIVIGTNGPYEAPVSQVGQQGYYRSVTQ